MMKIEYIALTLIALLLGGCSKEKPKGAFVDYMPVQIEEDDRWSFIGRNGEIFLKQEFEEDDEPSPIINGVFYVGGNNGITVYRLEDGKCVEIEGLEGLVYAGYMQDGLMPVCKKGERICVVDKDGLTHFELSAYDGIEVDACNSFAEGFMLVRLQDDTYVYVDKEGNNAFGRRFKWGTNFVNGHAFVKELDDSSYNQATIIDKTGEVIYQMKGKEELDEDCCISFQNKLFSFEYDDRFLVYDFNGNELCRCPTKVEDTHFLLEDYYIYEDDDDAWGVMDYENKQLIRAKYDVIVPFGRYFLAIHENSEDEIKLIDIDDNEIKKIDGEKIIALENLGFDFPVIIDTDNDEMYIIDKKANLMGQSVARINYDDLKSGEFGMVESCYAPIDEISENMIGLTDVPSSYGAFVGKEGNRCFPKDVSFLRSMPINELQGKYEASITIGEGVNHKTDYYVYFDEPIARFDSTTLSNTAWLNKIVIQTACDEPHIAKMIGQQIVQKLTMNGKKQDSASDNGLRYLFVDKKNDVALKLEMTISYTSYVTIAIGCGCNASSWRQWVTANN